MTGGGSAAAGIPSACFPYSPGNTPWYPLANYTL